ncbi:hypothetical protein AB6A40_002341 [Gnathostoma spinigerum]|uniref:Uncharacterized protein n=1 Tax=Gnathostoma spinigerum TaxID=75299 RepID=A0ABD6EG15_9BILA
MNQQAFFSTAGSGPIGQPQLLDSGLQPVVTSIQFQTGSSTSIVYPSATSGATFYATSNSPFQPLTVLPTAVRLPSSSTLMPVSSDVLTFTSSSQADSSNVAQLAPITISHLQLTPVQLSNELPTEDHRLLFDSFYMDDAGSSTSNALDQQQLRLHENDNLPSTSELSATSAADVKRQKQAEAARLRYQRMSVEERKEVNARRTLAQKRKKQRDKELEELEALLRKSKDIEDDPAINEQLREKRIRARRADAARLRYQRMSSEERRIYNQRRRMRQLDIHGAKKNATDDEQLRARILAQNARKAEAARLRYHRMTDEEKRKYNQRRTEAFRRRRKLEEDLLATPAGRISAEALNKAQQIMMRNAKRAEAARLRYQRMSPEQRKLYNQKRSNAKKQREQRMNLSRNSILHHLTPVTSVGITNHGGQKNGNQNALNTLSGVGNSLSEEALIALEKEVVKRTRQANMVLMQQQRDCLHDQLLMVSTNPDGTQTVIPASTTEDGKRVFHIPSTNQLYELEPTVESELFGKETPSDFVNVVHSNASTFHEGQTDCLEDSGSTQPCNLGPTSTHCVASNEPQLIASRVTHSSSLDLRNLQSPTISIETVLTKQESTTNQPQQQLILTVQEPQQPVQHQIIVTDLNQPTGAVLSSVGNHIRTRGRPPLYAAAAASLQRQQQQQQEQQQQRQQQQQQQQQQQDEPQNELVVISENGQMANSLSTPGIFCDPCVPSRVSMRCVRQTATTDILAVATAATVGPNNEITPQEKLKIQRARRAERARMRYHNMSEEERRNFNARRANALRKARLRDEQLCQMADNAELTGRMLDESTMLEVEMAQRRRARRAEAARIKYHRMSCEERRQFNAMRDAQRRQRKRMQEQREAAVLSAHKQVASCQALSQHNANANQSGENESLVFGSYLHYDDALSQNWSA